ISKPIVVIFIGGPVLFLMSFSDYIVAHCEADLKWMGPFHYPCRDSRNLSIRPAATPRGWCIPQTLELLESNQGIKMKPICSFAFNKESSMPFCNFAGKDELLKS
ncbi:hypothetical protein ACRN9F_24585, partial [Shewanella oncorhynchi]|uniref:hypothetical protein n=1 Tax=Shewanella oncorhynchi TaxID=2726434 RepID=UPI003D7B3918